MSRYLDRVVSLALGAGPRLRPRPRYRFGAAPQRVQGEAAGTRLEVEETAGAGAVTVMPAAAADRANVAPASRMRTALGEAITPQAADAQGTPRVERLLPLEPPMSSTSPTSPTSPMSRADDPERANEAPLHAADDRIEPPGQQLLRAPQRDDREIARVQPGPGRTPNIANVAHVASTAHANRNRSSEAAPPATRVRPPAGARSSSPHDEAPVVMVRIGRIEIHAVSAPGPAAPARRAESGLRTPSLDAYLKTRDRGRS